MYPVLRLYNLIMLIVIFYWVRSSEPVFLTVVSGDSAALSSDRT